ncbi:hypothetical protein [Lysobacter sp. D1-1-M9]|uniref:hypothetical protein n=1 Tax=Novilysobacter longmucuonensis TaxID=3098603 RepID=UPI00398345AC
MPRHPLAFALFSACGFAAAVLATRTDASDMASPDRAQGVEARAPASGAAGIHARGEVPFDGMIAAAMIEAVTREFGQPVDVRLAKLDVRSASLRDLELHGHGELQISDGEGWIPFEFEALYDTRRSSVSHPRLRIGHGQATTPLATDSDIARELRAQVRRTIRGEFGQQPVSLSLEDVRIHQEVGRYLRVEALGIADFHAEGDTAAQVQGLLDPHTGRWLRVQLELGTPPAWADVRPVALAAQRSR